MSLPRCEITTRVFNITLLAPRVCSAPLSSFHLRHTGLGASSPALLLRADVGHVLREGVLLIFAEGPGGFEMIVVDKGVDGMVHVPVVRALQVRRALELERQRLRVRRVISVHGRLVSPHAVGGL